MILIVGFTVGLLASSGLERRKDVVINLEREGRALGLKDYLAQTGNYTPPPEETPPSNTSTNETPPPYTTPPTATETSPYYETPSPTQAPTTTSPTETTYGTPYPEYTPQPVGGVPQETQTIDRLAQVDTPTLDCIRARLTSYELERLRYLVPLTATEEDEIRRLTDKVKICFESYSETIRIEEASGKISEVPSQLEECLIGAVGGVAYTAIKEGTRQPTQDEQKRMEGCFGGEFKSEVRYQSQDQNLSADIESCLKLAVGDRKFELIKEGVAEPSLEEREKVERCFGASAQPFQARPTFEIPLEIDACLRESVGLVRYEAIKSGTTEPTEEEKAKGEECFAKLNETQVNFLPAPPEQVPYLPVDPEVVEVATVSERTEEIAPGVVDRKLVFSGKGLPNSVVDIYIFTEPIVVTTKTDENGDWVYELNLPLDAGKHVAYAAVRTQSGEAVRSAVFNFEVAAVGPGTLPLLEEEKATQVPSRFLTYALWVMGLGALLAIAGGAYVSWRNLKLVKAERKSESETTSSSVN